MRKKTKLVYDVGVNDSDYPVNPSVNGVRVLCPYYSVWHSVLERCFSSVFLIKRPTYAECTVCKEWLVFSNFKAWMETQNWVGKHLDKDLLVIGNKHYSPETCVFVDPIVNTFLLDCKASRGKYMVGVCWSERDGKFSSRCRNGKRSVSLGNHHSELEAHLAWREHKHKVACELADKQSDPRVTEALRNRFAPNDAVPVAPETNKEAA